MHKSHLPPSRIWKHQKLQLSDDQDSLHGKYKKTKYHQKLDNNKIIYCPIKVRSQSEHQKQNFNAYVAANTEHIREQPMTSTTTVQLKPTRNININMGETSTEKSEKHMRWKNCE